MDAVRRATSTGLALALTLSVFLTDQVSKRLIQGSLRPGESIPAIPGVLRITYTRNDGGAFGILGGQSSLLLIGSAVAVAVVLWMLLQGPPARATALGCGLILGAAAVAIVLGVAVLFLAALRPETTQQEATSDREK